MTSVRSTVVLLIIALFVPAASAGAADVNVSATVDNNDIYEDESFTLTIEISGDVSNAPDLALPDLDGFNSYASGTTRNFTFVNGRSQISKSYTFKMIPTRSGNLQLPPFTLEIDGKKYTTQPITISVRSGSAPRSNTSSRRRQAPSSNQRRSSGISPDDLFITTSVDKDTVYVNEQITLSFKFYQADGVDVLQNPDFKPPQKTGFWVEDLPPRNTGYKTVNGRRYHLTEIKTALFPTTSGEPTIGAAELTLVVREPRSRDPFSMFNRDFFGFNTRGQTVPLKSDPIKIVSLPLPSEGKPDDFSGAVGNYSISAQIDKQMVEANEPITMKVRISGTGNIKSIAPPEMPELPDFRSYQSGDSENTTPNNYRIGGTKAFEYVFIPKRAGTYMLPTVSYSFFDPSTKSYKTVSTEPIQVEVTPAKDRYVSQMQSLEANKIDLVAKDIRYLKSDIGRINGGKSRLLAIHPLFLALYLLPLIGYFVVVGQKRRHDRLQTDRGYRRLKQARKMATRRLAQAEKFLEESDAGAFYAEVNRSVIEYFGDRFDLPSFGLTADRIEKFAEGRLDEALTRKLLDLLRQSDFGRFAPGGSDREQMRQLWQEAGNLIVELEKSR